MGFFFRDPIRDHCNIVTTGLWQNVSGTLSGKFWLVTQDVMHLSLTALRQFLRLFF